MYIDPYIVAAAILTLLVSMILLTTAAVRIMNQNDCIIALKITEIQLRDALNTAWQKQAVDNSMYHDQLSVSPLYDNVNDRPSVGIDES